MLLSESDELVFKKLARSTLIQNTDRRIPPMSFEYGFRVT
jgi:hypothetical protein